jgi:hypothetical protein
MHMATRAAGDFYTYAHGCCGKVTEREHKHHGECVHFKRSRKKRTSFHVCTHTQSFSGTTLSLLPQLTRQWLISSVQPLSTQMLVSLALWRTDSPAQALEGSGVLVHIHTSMLQYTLTNVFLFVSPTPPLLSPPPPLPPPLLSPPPPSPPPPVHDHHYHRQPPFSSCARQSTHSHTWLTQPLLTCNATGIQPSVWLGLLRFFRARWGGTSTAQPLSLASPRVSGTSTAWLDQCARRVRVTGHSATTSFSAVHPTALRTSILSMFRSASQSLATSPPSRSSPVACPTPPLVPCFGCGADR